MQRNGSSLGSGGVSGPAEADLVEQHQGPFSRGPTIDSAPASLQLRIYCGPSVTLYTNMHRGSTIDGAPSPLQLCIYCGSSTTLARSR